MWSVIATFLISITSSQTAKEKLFSQDQIIFTSNFNITSIIVPSHSNRFPDSLEIPNVFFTAANPKFQGGSCIYVLQGFDAYEVLKGGRDTTSDFSSDPSIYFGARNGIYKYYSETISAKKFGNFYDDIKQIQKANGADVIYILTTDNKIYKIEDNGRKRKRFEPVPCATQFVLDTSNNVYYVSCGENLPHTVKADETIPNLTANIFEDFKDVKLLRPAFIMENCVPFIADGDLYVLYANGTAEKKDFSLQERPSAYSVDAAIYILAALDGKIYEFNVMDVLLNSMYRSSSEIGDVTKIVLDVLPKTRDNLFGFHHSLRK